jgi:hypothetical protein
VIYDMILQQFQPVGRGRRRGDLPVNGESVLIFMVLAAGGLLAIAAASTWASHNLLVTSLTWRLQRGWTVSWSLTRRA